MTAKHRRHEGLEVSGQKVLPTVTYILILILACSVPFGQLFVRETSWWKTPGRRKCLSLFSLPLVHTDNDGKRSKKSVN